jgi:YHYH protein
VKKFARIAITVLFIITAISVAQKGPGALKKKSSSKNSVKIKIRGDYRYITANGIPDHQAGKFPNSHNPNRISSQKYQFRVKADPKIARKTTKLQMGPFGVAINGVPFDPFAAEFWQRNPQSGWQYEPLSGHINLGLDKSNAHVQPNGAYHYHGNPKGLVSMHSHKEEMVLVGYAADGFPIYSQYGYSDPEDKSSKVKKIKSSYRLKKGKRPDGPRGKYDGTFVQDYEFIKEAGDLDECNGRFGITPEYSEGIYHYYITDTFYLYTKNVSRNTGQELQA